MIQFTEHRFYLLWLDWKHKSDGITGVRKEKGILMNEFYKILLLITLIVVYLVTEMLPMNKNKIVINNDQI